MISLAREHPHRRPGSPGDNAVAAIVAAALRSDGFAVASARRPAKTADGPRSVETVTATRTGLRPGSIVIVSHRDALGSPAVADLSGTAALLRLADALSGETLQHTVVLVSTSGAAGLAGASEVAGDLTGAPVEAVLALGDLAGARTRQPVVVPWSGAPSRASTMLRNTVVSALAAQAGLAAAQPRLGAQLAHLALPVSVTEQAPFGAAGMPAVLLSLAGERPSTADEPVAGPDRLTALGRTILQVVGALDEAPRVPAASGYLLVSGKVVPSWGVRMLSLALLVPALLTTIDGLARARRRGHTLSRWVLWVLAGAAPFLLAWFILAAANLLGVLAPPPGPAPAGAVPLAGAGPWILGVVALALAGALAGRRRLIDGLLRHGVGDASANPGAAAAVLVIMSAVALVTWMVNPVAALLIVPALHLWPWVIDPDRRLPRALSVLFLLAGLLPTILVVVLDALTLGFGPLDVVWTGALLVSVGYVGPLTVASWCLLLACLLSVLAIVRGTPRVRRAEPDEPRVSVRGPVSYAGPGSLGGTESALRR